MGSHVLFFFVWSVPTYFLEFWYACLAVKFDKINVNQKSYLCKKITFKFFRGGGGGLLSIRGGGWVPRGAYIHNKITIPYFVLIISACLKQKVFRFNCSFNSSSSTSRTSDFKFLGFLTSSESICRFAVKLI